jgi:hypothetical protein
MISLFRCGDQSVFLWVSSQASDVGSIPIARSINPVDAVGFTGFPPSKVPLIPRLWTQLDAKSTREESLGRDEIARAGPHMKVQETKKLDTCVSK